jgi:hypothetical protein
MANTTRFNFEIPDVGVDSDQWGDILNAYFNSLETVVTDKRGDTGANLTNLNASNIATGTIANARTTASVATAPNTIVLRDAVGDVTLGKFSYSGDVTSTAMGAFGLPVGSTAQRPASPFIGIRYNTTISQFEGYNGTTWASVGGGATGGGADTVFQLNSKTVTTSFTIPADKNAFSVGVITIANGVTVTIPNGSRWVIA